MLAQSSLCLHMIEECKRGLGRGTLTRTIPAAVSDTFRFGSKSPTRSMDGNNILLKQVKETIKKRTPKPGQKRPISREQLLQMVEAMKPRGDATEIRDVCILVFMFVGFLRESEAMQLLLTDVSITTQVEEGTDLGEPSPDCPKIQNGQIF